MQNLIESEAIALSAPFSHALVTSIDKNGRPNAIAIAWATRTSFKPFLASISIDQYSHEGIQVYKEFVLNCPSEDQADATWICDTKTGRDGDKIRIAGLKLVDSKAVKVRTIDGATVAFE